MIVRGVLQRWTFDKKPLLKCSSSENMAKLLKIHLKEFILVHFQVQACIFTQEQTAAQLFAIALVHQQNSQFLKLLPLVDSASIVFAKRYSSDVIQRISFEL